jgi:threonyl-tRNA synthetase
VLQFVLDLYKMFGFDDYSMELSTRPEKSIGSAEMWEQAEKALAEALVRNDIEYTLNPGDGAFYGPKIDFHIRDSMGRTWQCGTIQLDFNMPSEERFDLTYAGEDNADHRLVVIHRALLGSMERFLGILLEHWQGEFALWLAPVQVTVLPISDKYADYAHKVCNELLAAGIRADLDDRDEKLGRRIRDNEMKHTPVLLVVGEQEAADGTASVRRRGTEEQKTLEVGHLIVELNAEIAARLAP